MAPTCSAKGCQVEAVWSLLWNNPKLHTADRRKVWLACDEHRSTLAEFLSARRFLRDVEPLDPPAAAQGGPSAR